jgi:hypothetical protein
MAVADTSLSIRHQLFILLRGPAGNVTVFDGTNLATGTVTGTKIATAAAQKVGFHGLAPTVQAAGWVAWTGTATRTAIATGAATAANCAEAIKALTDDLRTKGLIV